VIELSEPLYAVGGGNVSGTKDLNHHDTNDVTDDDGDDDDDENASDDDDDNDDDDDEETSDNTEVKIEELPNHASLSLDQALHLETSVTDINTIEIKTIFKADKQQQPQQQHADYSSMNVQTLKQHLKTKLSADGMHYNETAINKLNKKELIKHLTQG
jgi:cobalamin biosynthesis protein CobT